MNDKTELKNDPKQNVFKKGLWWAIFFSSLMLAAHFSRNEQDILGLLILVFPLFLGLDKKWLWQLQTIILGTGTVVWVYATYVLLNIRLDAEQPYIRLLLILSLIIIYNAVVFYRTYKFLINKTEEDKK